MNKHLRSGLNRRQHCVTISEDWRINEERRMILRNPEMTKGRLKIVSIFKSLSNDHLKTLLPICSKNKYRKNQNIFKIGDNPTDMLLLIEGKFKILFGHINEYSILPNEMIGEIGFFTGEKRSATVIAETSCTTLNFNKKELFKVLEKNYSMWVNIQLNIIKKLSNRIRQDIEVIDGLSKKGVFDII